MKVPELGHGRLLIRDSTRSPVGEWMISHQSTDGLLESDHGSEDGQAGAERRLVSITSADRHCCPFQRNSVSLAGDINDQSARGKLLLRGIASPLLKHLIAKGIKEESAHCRATGCSARL